MAGAYYNENDPKAAAWLRELIAHGLIAPGEVDERSIADVQPGDLMGFAQCHFFAGIGGWSYALRLAGWPDDRHVWTGSCPCQPFSAAGKRLGKKDARHLWPQFRRLIRKCRPADVFGEQVASADGRVWLSGVFADLEALGYRAAGADLCSAGVGAPHIRQRLFWVANATDERHGQQRDGQTGFRQSSGSCSARRLANVQFARLEGHAGNGGDGHEPGWVAADAVGSTSASSCASKRMGYSTSGRCGERGNASLTGSSGHIERASWSGFDGMGDANSGRCEVEREQEHRTEQGARRPLADGSGARGFWGGADLIPCRDGKARRIESGLEPLAYGVSGRVGLLRGYGNAINPVLASEFIQACEEALT